MQPLEKIVAVAPMMDWTDRHCRFFHRGLTRRALLYTEMVTAEAVIRGDRERLLGFDPVEHPVALQLGGSEPGRLAEAARIGAGFGYDEINLNVGCPSDRVQSGTFGACLMREPALVGDCVAAMKAAVPCPVTVKCRLGVDEQDPEEALDRLADAVDRGRRRRDLGACAQGLAEGPVAEGEPRRAAARLWPRLSAEGSACPTSSSASTAASPTSTRRRRISIAMDGVDARARGLPESRDARRRRSDAWRCRRTSTSDGRGGAHDPLRRTATARRAGASPR